MIPSALRAPLPGLAKHAAVARVFLYALLVRAVFDLAIQRPLEHGRSDMGGYIGRAMGMFDKPFEPEPIVTFFPYGTHMLLFAVLRLFGRANFVAVGLLYATLGATAVAATYATARRLFLFGAPTARNRLPIVVAVFFTLYPTWVHLGGFVLSEVPLSAAVALSTFFALRFLDEGRWRDAWLLGASVAVGATFRPQLLAFVPMLAIAAVARRRAWFRRTGALRFAVALVVPIAVVLGASAARTEFHTGRFGLVSTNGAFNFVFGRCHASQLTAELSRGGSFTPPSLNAIAKYRDHYGTDPLIPLDPALGNSISFHGQLWDEAPALALAKKCVEVTGPWRQVKYAASHVALLWIYNSVWPTTGPVATVTVIAHAILILPGLAIGVVLLFARRDARLWVLGAQAGGLVFTAMLVFGEARLRAPYDGVLDTLALAGYAAVVPRIVARIRRRKSAPRDAPSAPATDDSSSPR